MNVRKRKCNSDHGSSSKKEPTFLPLSPIESTITKSKFQVSGANYSFAEDNNMCKIANAENVHDCNDNAIRNESQCVK